MRILFFLIFENLVSSKEKWFDHLEFEECELELSNGRVSGKTIQAGDKSIEIYRGNIPRVGNGTALRCTRTVPSRSVLCTHTVPVQICIILSKFH